MASAGRVLLLSKENWASGIPYMPMDYVLYKGSSYVCKAAVSGVTGPDQDPTHWQMLAEGFDIAQAAQTLDSDPQKFPSNKAVSDALTGKVGNNDLLSLSQISAGSESTLEKKAPSAAAVKQLNESLTELTTNRFATPTNVTDIAIEGGGYAIMGKLVIVNMRFRFTGTANTLITIVSDMPNALIKNITAFTVMEYNHDTHTTEYAILHNGNTIRAKLPTSNTIYVLSGVYIMD